MRQPEKWGAASQTTAVPSPEGVWVGGGRGLHVFDIVCSATGNSILVVDDTEDKIKAITR
jgi:hypothetical protein